MKLKNKRIKLILLCLSMLCSLILIGGIITALKTSASAKSLSNPSISLRKAYVLADRVAEQWDSKSELSSITSVDDPQDMNVKYGADGKRKNWNITFAAPHTNKLLIVTIHSGKIYKKTPSTGTGPVVSYSPSAMDSVDAIKEAYEYFSLRPGVGFAEGYHFTLNNVGSTPELTVYGTDEKGYMTTITFDASTGKLVGAQHKIPSGGGLFLFDQHSRNITDFGFSGAFIQSITTAPNFKLRPTIIVSGVSDPFSVNRKSFTKITTDGGQNWSDIILPVSTNKFVIIQDNLSDTTIWAIGHNSVYRSTDNGRSWELLLNTKATILNTDIGTSRSALLTQNSVIISNNNFSSYSIQSLPSSDIRSIKLSSDGVIYAASNRGTIYKFENKKWIEIQSPFPDRPILLVTNSNSSDIIAFSTSSVGILSISTSNWKTADLPNGNDVINDVKQDGSGNVLLGTNSSKLYVYKKETNQVNVILTSVKGGISYISPVPSESRVLIGTIPSSAWKPLER